MKLEQQVTSLEISKHLQELGVKQESLFLWFWHEEKYEIVYKGKFYGNDELSAFTVAELGEIIKDTSFRLPEWSGLSWYLDERIKNDEDFNIEADARGKMLIYLLENNLITL